VASEVIREFLVALNFKSDAAALRKFEDGVNQATKAVFALAAAVEGTAVVVAAGIAKFASNLEALYYAAQRTGSAAANLRAMDRAAQDFGTTAGEMQASIEGLAHALRINAGGNEGLLEFLGVHLKRIKGGAVDAQDAVLQLSTAFQRMVAQSNGQLSVVEGFASMLGINEHSLLALLDPNFTEQYKKTLSLMSGVDWDKAAKDAHKFENQIRDLGTTFQSIFVEIGEDLAKKFGFKSIEEFNTWLQAHSHEIATRISDAIATIIQAAEWLGEKVLWLVGKFKEWDEETGGVSTKLLILAALLKVSGGGSIVGGVLNLAAAFVSLGTGAAAAVLSLAALSAALTAAYAAWQAWHGRDASNPISNFANKLFGTDSIGGSIYEMTHRGEQALQYFKEHGWSQNQAAGIVANLQAESGMRAGASNKGHFGLAQWDSGRQLDFKKLFGHDITDSTFEEQLAFINSELSNHREYGAAMLRAAQSSDQAARVFSHFYERPGNDAYEESRRAAIANNISQKTDIHVYGSGDPAQAAAKVSDAQKRTNAELARNVAAAMQ
jgi:hypothetical protein